MRLPSRRLVPLASLFAVLAAALPAQADLGFPDALKFPPQIVLQPDQALQKEDLAELELVLDKAGTTRTFKGRHWARWLRYVPAAGEPAAGYYNGTEQRIHQAMMGVALKGGWQLLRVDDNRAAWTMKLAGRELYAAVTMDAPQAQVHVDLIEVGAAGAGFSVPAPAAVAEKIGPEDDIPFLPPWPGSRRLNASRSATPLDISEPGRSQEAQLVGQAVLQRDYQPPATVSALQFIGEYREALLKAGWQVLFPSAAEVRQQATLVAHYTGQGRDLWARLNHQGGPVTTVQLADAGGDDLAGRLAKDCHVPLYGVLFDFDKATLRPESDAVLGRAAALLKADAGLKAEVQGHTDNVGSDDYNLKLSEARAASVRGWLVQHGVAAERLGSKGYGKSQPVADNASDTGRARNRRVELARLGCRR